MDRGQAALRQVNIVQVNIVQPAAKQAEATGRRLRF
jgi:hypothetical protein